MNWTQKQDFMRSMPSVAAKILLMMLWTNRSLDGKEWGKAVGASDKLVKESLDWLAERGLSQDNGRTAGWSLPSQLPLPFKQLWQGHSGTYLNSFVTDALVSTSDTASNDTETVTEPVDNFVDNYDEAAKEIGNSDLSPPLLINCLINKNSSPEEELINQPINQSETGNSELQRVMALTQPPIVPPTADQLAQLDIQAAPLLAWYWYALSQDWIDLPVGYAINRVRQDQTPPAHCLDLASLWLGLDMDGQDEFSACFWQGSPDQQLQAAFDLSPAAAALAVALRGQGAFD